MNINELNEAISKALGEDVKPIKPIKPTEEEQAFLDEMRRKIDNEEGISYGEYAELEDLQPQIVYLNDIILAQYAGIDEEVWDISGIDEFAEHITEEDIRSEQNFIFNARRLHDRMFDFGVTEYVAKVNKLCKFYGKTTDDYDNVVLNRENNEDGINEELLDNRVWKLFEESVAEYLVEKGITENCESYMAKHGEEIVNTVLEKEYDIEENRDKIVELWFNCPINDSNDDKVFDLMKEIIIKSLPRCLTIGDMVWEMTKK